MTFGSQALASTNTTATNSAASYNYTSFNLSGLTPAVRFAFSDGTRNHWLLMFVMMDIHRCRVITGLSFRGWPITVCNVV